jgi:hypothetical protein
MKMYELNSIIFFQRPMRADDRRRSKRPNGLAWNAGVAPAGRLASPVHVQLQPAWS